jgi:hypothetical protein
VIRQIAAAVVLTAGVSLPVLGFSAPAQAACINDIYGTWTNPDFSSNFNASINCGGVFARQTYRGNDYVRGHYYKDGGWNVSTLGWQWVLADVSGTDMKVIGDTVPGRTTHGQTYSINQNVKYRF